MESSMFAMQYSHRLPADYDVRIIRQRAAARGPLWDDTEGLICKAFALQERNRNGAVGNVYASVYLWSDSDATARFLMGERFQAVIDAFGRPQIETWLPLDARRGNAQQALSLYREERVLSAATDRTALHAAEIELNQQIAARPDTVAVWAALDLNAWRLIRFTVSSEPADPARSGDVYDVLHFAQPGVSRLPR
jgi:hypothetical protein